MLLHFLLCPPQPPYELHCFTPLPGHLLPALLYEGELGSAQLQFGEKFLGPGGGSGGVGAGVEKIVVKGGRVHEVAVHGGEDGVDHLLEGVVEVGLPLLGIGPYPGLLY